MAEREFRWGFERKRSAAETAPELLAAGCFVAGTPVHTREGLRPIEEIPVGDFVLSQPQFTGEVGYRRVADTFIVGERPVFEVTFCDASTPRLGCAPPTPAPAPPGPEPRALPLAIQMRLAASKSCAGGLSGGIRGQEQRSSTHL